MLKLTFYVPKASCEDVKRALFLAGAGKIGNYDSCCFELEGWGQFRALKDANPTIGKIGVVEKVLGVRVEMVLDDNILEGVIGALRKSHPYETPAFDVIKCMDV